MKNEDNREKLYDMLAMLFWSCWFQLMTITVLFFVDLVPRFGYTQDHDIHTFFHNFSNSWKCYFNTLDGCGDVWWHGVIFIGGYFLAYFCSAGLNESSAVYNLIANTLGSPATAFFWIIFPSLNPNTTNTPLWAVLPSLFLLVFGSFGWKVWETWERKRIKREIPREKSLINNGIND